VFKALRLLHHSTLGSRVIKVWGVLGTPAPDRVGLGFAVAVGGARAEVRQRGRGLLQALVFSV